MVKRAAVAMMAVLCTAGLASAQDSVIAAIKAQHDMIKSNLDKSAAKVSEADYAFKPTPDVRSFGQLVGHVANANYMICSVALGEQSPSRENIEQARTTKAAPVEAVKASFTYCDRAYAKPDAELTAQASLFGMQMSRLGVLAFNAAHDYEHYGNIVTYMRLKGMTPPSSAGEN